MPGADASLRLGLVGFGRVARDYYLPALRRLPGVRVVAVADPLPASRTAAAARCPAAEIHADHRALLARTDLDALLVASPPSTHLAVWSDAAARSLPVFMEKPLVLTPQLGAIDARDGRLMVDFNRRFWPAYQQVRDLVRRDRLGTPVAIEFRLHLDVLAWCTVTRHRLAPEEGGLLHDLGCQAIDLVGDLLGEEPTRIAAETWSARWHEDHVRLVLGFGSGSTAVCDLAYEGVTREQLVVRGPRATLRLADPNMALHLEPAGARPGRLAARCRDAAAFGYRALRPARAMGRSTIHLALAAFVRALRAGEPFSPGFDDGLRNARWVAAAARSAADGGAARRWA
jgi:predicted dehydrogenase